MKTMKNIKKHYRSLRKDRRGIDTILAALLMVVIVVVASVMVYAWSTGLLGTLLVTPHAGKEALTIEKYGFTCIYNVAFGIRSTTSTTATIDTNNVKAYSGNQRLSLS